MRRSSRPMPANSPTSASSRPMSCLEAGPSYRRSTSPMAASTTRSSRSARSDAPASNDGSSDRRRVLTRLEIKADQAGDRASPLSQVPSRGSSPTALLNLGRLVGELRGARRAARGAGAQPIHTRDLPSPDAVETIVERLHASLFPRHRGAHDDFEAGVDYFVGFNLSEALRELGEQVRRELRFTVGSPNGANVTIETTSSQIVGGFAAALPRIYELLASDIRAAYRGDPSAKTAEEVLLCFPGVKAIIH